MLPLILGLPLKEMNLNYIKTIKVLERVMNKTKVRHSIIVIPSIKGFLKYKKSIGSNGIGSYLNLYPSHKPHTLYTQR